MDDWLVLDISHNRDSDCLAESNFYTALKRLGGGSHYRRNIDVNDGEFDVAEIEFNHWVCGWVGHILVRPNTTAQKIAEELEEAIADYPILDDDDFSYREMKEANITWEVCFNIQDRIKYIREHRQDFDFRSFGDLMGCVRGKFFGGCASELL
jgi:hypothetical protein